MFTVYYRTIQGEIHFYSRYYSSDQARAAVVYLNSLNTVNYAWIVSENI